MNKRPSPPRLEAHINRQKLYLLLAAAVIGYIVMAWFFLDRVERYLVGAAVVIGVVFGLKQALSDKAKIVIDESGVLDSRLGFGTIRWRDITDVYVSEYQSVGHVCLKVSNPDHYLRSRSLVTKGLLKFHEKANDISPFNINVGVLDVGVDEIYEAVLQGIEYYEANDLRERRPARLPFERSLLSSET